MIYRLTDPRTLALIDLLRLVAERNLTEVEHILRGLSGGEDAPEPVSRADLAARLAEGSVTVSRRAPSRRVCGRAHTGRGERDASGPRRILPSLAPGAEIVAYCRGGPTASMPTKPSPPSESGD